MLIYFIITSIPLVAHFFRFSIYGRNTEKIIVLILAIFFCFGYMTGSDWRQYEVLYENLDFSNFSFDTFSEPGFSLINIFFKLLGFDFWVFLIITKLFCFFVAVRFIKKTTPEYFFLSLFVYLCLFASFLYIDNPLRNLITVSIFMLSLNLIKEKKMVKFLTITIFSMSIHLSACLLIPFYFIANKRISSSSIIIIYIAINLIFTFFIEQIFSIIINSESIIPFYSNKITAYFVEESIYAGGKFFSLGYISKIAIFILAMIYRKKLEYRFGILFFNCFIAYLILYKVGLSIIILGRFSLYFSVFYCIVIAFLASSFNKQSKPFYNLFVMFISYFSLFTVITSSHKYIPYSNYLNYIFQEKPDFTIRSNYNFQNSPYYIDEEK